MKKLNNIKKTGFEVPKDYFHNMEDKIMDAIKLNDALQNMGDAGFKAPEGYFDALEDVVLTKIKDSKNPKVISLFNKQTLMYISGVAAAILIMFSVFWNKNEVSIDTIEAELVENYFIEQGINTYEIASLLTEDNNDINLDIELFDDTFNDDSLEDYLLENVNLEDFIDQ
ncbi:hypothetical protein [Pontimicrobium aquaticum]|uniref:Uncharacterized protein n=1 Tax=Pontimicrobium aquaticum TaxID=2565367 RepID=A0A4U0EW26_9FLAO|nr:hypothetical protein [Pontimicrobium aquaticum]TJY36151.1 hypothetical protein E5167_05645 [Pontimicrobium aquaticum]